MKRMGDSPEENHLQKVYKGSTLYVLTKKQLKIGEG